MDRKFLMGINDWLIRSQSYERRSTYMSQELRTNLMMIAMKTACEFYSDFFDQSISHLDYKLLVEEYNSVLSDALSLELFAPGGVGEKDHLNLWCLNKVLSPEVYVESGVYIGSSLHAFIESPSLKKIIAIDPSLRNLKISKEKMKRAEFIEDQDFSQIKVNLSEREALVYFDDHINTATRILQCYQKGFKYALFDDSTGLEGICQGLFPAIPTIPMIMNFEKFPLGEELAWSFTPDVGDLKKQIINKITKTLFRRKDNRTIRVSLTITQEFIDQCSEAKNLIKKCNKIPDLGEFIPQTYPRKMADTSKFLVEINQN